LLHRILDYAGLYPPATLPIESAIANYQGYQHGTHNWMLRWLVVGPADLASVPRELDGALAVLGNADEQRAAVIEAKQIIQASRPVYCEVSIEALGEVQQAGCFAKLRTGGVTADAIPSIEDVAAFILACAERRLPFKATAGLHHPIRSSQPLTYEVTAPRALVHGFLNVFMAAAFAWHGRRAIEPILAETNADAFHFDDRAHWRSWSLEAGQVRAARQQFAHSFGSCSFDEPVHDLEAHGLL
jgi:hypothetical protein